MHGSSHVLRQVSSPIISSNLLALANVKDSLNLTFLFAFYHHLTTLKQSVIQDDWLISQAIRPFMKFKFLNLGSLSIQLSSALRFLRTSLPLVSHLHFTTMP